MIHGSSQRCARALGRVALCVAFLGPLPVAATIDDPRVVVLAPLEGEAERSQLTAVGDRLYSVVREGERWSVWTDATPPIAPVEVYAGDIAIDGLVASAGRLLFNRSTTILPPPGIPLILTHQRVERWSTDGSLEGTGQYDLTGPGTSVVCGDSFFTVTPGSAFTGVDPILRRSEGSLQTAVTLGLGNEGFGQWTLRCVSGTVLLVGNVGSLDPAEGFPESMLDALGARQFVGGSASIVEVNGVAYVTVTTQATDGPFAQGASIIRTDGTEAGTSVVVHDPRLAWGTRLVGSIGERVVWIGSTDADDGRYALWVTDGTPGNRTQLVEVRNTDLMAEVGSSADVLFFTMQGALWRTDGTGAGTFPILSPFDRAALVAFAAFDDVVYLGIDGATETAPAQLWRSDGTKAGTVVLGALAGPSVSLARVGDRVFVASEPLSEPMTPPNPCAGAAWPVACELAALAALQCEDPTASLRPRQQQRLLRIAAQASRGNARATARAVRLLARLERRLAGGALIRRLGDACAQRLAEQVSGARLRIAQAASATVQR